MIINSQGKGGTPRTLQGQLAGVMEGRLRNQETKSERSNKPAGRAAVLLGPVGGDPGGNQGG